MAKKSAPSESPPDTGAGAPVPAPEVVPAPPLPPPQEIPVTGPKKSNLSSNVTAALASAPPPSQEAIDAHQAREAGEEAPEQGPKTRNKPGPKPGNPRKSPAPNGYVAPAQSPEVKRMAFRKVGYEIADLLIVAGLTLGGEDWQPKVIHGPDKTVLYDERMNLREAWADMAEYHQWEKFPAWLGVTLATASYIAPRIMAPSTQARVSKFKLWLDSMKLKRQEAKNARASADADKAAQAGQTA